MTMQSGRPEKKHVRLKRAEKSRLEEIVRRRAKVSGREYQRAQILLRLHEGSGLTATAKEVGVGLTTVQKIRNRYLDDGLEVALGDKARPGQPPKCSDAEEARIIALACSTPPHGASRWSTRLLVEEVKRQNIVKEIGRETVRVILERHELKPWREKNVVRSRA